MDRPCSSRSDMSSLYQRQGRNRNDGSSFNRRLSFALFLMTLLYSQSSSSSLSQVQAESHPHQGKVTPFVAGDPKVKLDKKALTILRNDKPYQTQILSPDGSSGRGLVVQDVAAPTKVVWDRILDYNHYADMVPKTTYSKNYKVQHHKKHRAQTIFTKMTVGFPMLKLNFYIQHEYQPKLNSLTWTLDYSKRSDLDDSCGYWYVIPHPEDPDNKTRVYYSVQVSMFDWVPQFVVNFMCNKALTDATGWVKKYSEKEYYRQASTAMKEKESKSKTRSSERKRRGALSWFFATTTDGETTKDEGSSSPEKRSRGATNTTPSSPKESMGLARYGLMTYVFALGVYNVHLYLSQ